MAEHAVPPPDPQPRPVDHPSTFLLKLLDLGKRARLATSEDELTFLLVNGTHGLAPFRQAALWWVGQKVTALSGVVEPDRNAPYVNWLDQLLRSIHSDSGDPLRLDVSAIPTGLRDQWTEWLPAHAVALPLRGKLTGYLLLARDTTFSDQELALLIEWCQTWLFVWEAMIGAKTRKWYRRTSQNQQGALARPRRWYRRRSLWFAGAVLIVLLLPIRMSVLAPSEVVPAQPVVVRAPIEGVIAQFDAQPNSLVKQDQPLFSFDSALIEARVLVAQQALETALAQYRQTSQLALFDAKHRVELAAQAGNIEEKRSEFEYLKEQRQRSQVRAPIAGTVLYDDPTSWIGRPVGIGERILRIARPGDIEVEAWLSIADAIDLEEGDPVTLYLQSDPLKPIYARLHYFSHEAVLRPDGSYAFRIRAKLEGGQDARVGLKGTARISGRWTLIGYWLLRRPLASVRTMLGL